MRSPQLLATGSTSINMTPMIDVVFLLIIFFLVSSHLAKQENSVKLDLPAADSGLADEPTDSNTCVVNVLENGSWRMGAAEVDRSNLADGLRQRLEASDKPPRLKIRTDRNVAYREVEPILSIASRIGIGDIVFAVYENREPN